MRLAAVLVLGLWYSVVFGLSITNNNREIETHVTKACELAWSSGDKTPTVTTIEQCKRRVMSAMTIDNALRNNELKRMLTASEKELASCKLKLEGDSK